MLRNPLHVKMRQELKNESQEQTNRILTHTEQMNNIRRISSDNGLPHDLFHVFRGFDDDGNDPSPPKSKGARVLATSR